MTEQETRSGACGLIWLNTGKLAWSGHRDDWQIESSFLILWMVVQIFFSFRKNNTCASLKRKVFFFSLQIQNFFCYQRKKKLTWPNCKNFSQIFWVPQHFLQVFKWIKSQNQRENMQHNFFTSKKICSQTK